jgi:hypothetical protein
MGRRTPFNLGMYIADHALVRVVRQHIGHAVAARKHERVELVVSHARNVAQLAARDARRLRRHSSWARRRVNLATQMVDHPRLRQVRRKADGFSPATFEREKSQDCLTNFGTILGAAARKNDTHALGHGHSASRFCPEIQAGCGLMARRAQGKPQ